jgi:hypothetical protein
MRDSRQCALRGLVSGTRTCWRVPLALLGGGDVRLPARAGSKGDGAASQRGHVPKGTMGLSDGACRKVGDAIPGSHNFGRAKEPSRSGTKAKQRSEEQGRAIGGCRVPCASVADS